MGTMSSRWTLTALAAFGLCAVAPAAELAASNGTAQISNSIGMKLVLIPAGEFLMGSRETAEETAAFFKKALETEYVKPDLYRSARPQHRVRITAPFYLGACHVTRGQFRKFVEETNYKTAAEWGAWELGSLGWNAAKKTVEKRKEYTWRNPGFEQSDEHPVLCVSWHDAVAFCRWLSRKEGRIYRLPTEAEWEYACRAGTTTRFSCGDAPDGLAKVGNVGDASLQALFPDLKGKGALPSSDGYVFTSPVGSFQPNAFGLFDMHGDAQQWCADWFGENYYSTSPQDDPQGPDKGERRVVRGSAWANAPFCAGSATRRSATLDNRSVEVGFRVALAASPARPASRFDGRITISRETTRILGPLDKEGHVDYLAALNQHCSLGVTPENNAAIPVWQALGPGPLAVGTEERFYHMLGIKPLPGEGIYFTTLDEYAVAHKQGTVAKDGKIISLWDRYEAGLQRPWSAEEFPLLAAWLKANEVPHGKLLEAATRSRYYSPLLNADASSCVLTALLPDAGSLRECGRLLAARAMLRLNDGRPELAWQDVIACHRLARLCGQGPFAVQQLVARRLHQLACRATAAMAAHGGLDPKLAAQMLADLDALPPLPKSAEVLNIGERCGFLDMLGRTARGGPRELRRVVATINQLSGSADNHDSKPSDFKDSPDRWVQNESVDWDLVAMFGNRWFDMLAHVSEHAPSHSTCTGTHMAMDSQLRELTDSLAGGGTSKKYALGILFLGNVLPQVKSFDMFGVLAGLLTPACSAMDTSEYRAKAELQLARLSLALAIYHCRTGQYPNQLEQLAPAILTAVPLDPFTGKGLHYEAKQGSYVLYSLGPMETDDGGRDRESQPPGWNVILPLPPKTKASSDSLTEGPDVDPAKGAARVRAMPRPK
jgi:formylglycine-generating enzyme